MRLITILIPIIVLAGCGSETSDSSSGSAAVPPADPQEISSSAKAISSTRLSETPILRADALGLNKVMREPGPCPFLSDETIIASVKSSFEFTRREVSNHLCRWAYNAGFSMEVTIENLATARPVKDRRYNTGIDPVMVPQDGPGTNAVILNDTAWDKEIPYAYSFEQDGKLVFIKYTGVNTRATEMRAAADEISARLGSAPTIDPQRRELTSPFKPCETWSDASILSAFGLSPDATVRSSTGSALNSCQWYIRDPNKSGEKMLLIMFAQQAANKPLKLTGYTENSDGGLTYHMKTESSEFGHYVKMVTYIEGGYLEMTLLNQDAALPKVATALNRNLIGRLTPS